MGKSFIKEKLTNCDWKNEWLELWMNEWMIESYNWMKLMND